MTTVDTWIRNGGKGWPRGNALCQIGGKSRSELHFAANPDARWGNGIDLEPETPSIIHGCQPHFGARRLALAIGLPASVVAGVTQNACKNYRRVGTTRFPAEKR